MGQAFLLLTLKHPLDLTPLDVEFVFLPEDAFSQVPPPGGPVEGPTDPQPPVVFPWVQVPSPGAAFDRLRVETKDAISWFFEPDQWNNAAGITLCEAPSQDENAHNPSGEDSWGVWQINLVAHGAAINAEQARNIWTATEYAARLFHARGNRWSDWWTCAGRLGLPR